MSNKILSLVVLGLLAVCQAEPAVAKGFSTSYGSRSSSFSSSRSYSAPAPRPAPTVTRNVTVNKTTVVHQNSGGSGSGMLTGLLVGSMLSNHNNAPVIVQQPAPQVIQQQPQIVEQVPVQAPAPQVVYEQAPKEEESHWFLNLLILGAVGTGVYYLIKKSTNKSA